MSGHVIPFLCHRECSGRVFSIFLLFKKLGFPAWRHLVRRGRLVREFWDLFGRLRIALIAYSEIIDDEMDGAFGARKALVVITPSKRTPTERGISFLLSPGKGFDFL